MILIPNAHNGLLELLLQIGIVGTSLFLFIWLRTFLIAIKCLNGTGRQFAVSTLMLLVSILETAVSEEVLLAAAQIWTVLFFTMGLICERQLRFDRGRGRREWPRFAANRRSSSVGKLHKRTRDNSTVANSLPL